MERGLIVNADDFGLSPGVNAGVARAHEDGILTSASLMVRYPAAAAAAKYARESGLGVGLHVDLGEWSWRDGVWTAVYEVVPLDDDVEPVRKELHSQLERFRELTGRDPTHLDSHQHVHTHGPIGRMFDAVAGELGVPLRHRIGGVRYCGDLYGHDAHGQPIPEAITPEALIHIIRGLPPGFTELACHPGIGSDTGSRYDREREQEVQVLTDPRVIEAVREEQIALRSFADIPSVGPRDR